MEVVGDPVRNRDSSIWSSPLSLGDQRQHVSSNLSRSESAPQSIFDAFAQPATKRNLKTHTRSHSISQPFDFLDHGHEQSALNLGIHSVLLEEENEDVPAPQQPPTEQQTGHSDSGLSSSSVSGSSVVQDSLAASPSRLSQLEHQASKLHSSASTSSALGSNPAHRPPTQPASSLRSFGSSRRHPSRSVSSIELAAIMNGSVASNLHGISAVPAHVSGTASSSNSGDCLAKLRSSGGKAVNWQKSVFDMIQDDFPRTPAPMLVTSKSVNNAREMRSTNPRIPAAERRARIQSTSSLDIDFGVLGLSENTVDPTPKLSDVDELRRRSTPSRGHRRSVSVNWTGDIPGLTEDQPIAQSSRHSALKPSKSSYSFGGKQVQIATSAPEQKQPTQQYLSVPSSNESSRGASPHGGIPVGGNRPPASAAAAAAAASTAYSSSPSNTPAKRGSPVMRTASMQEAENQMAGQINSNVLQSNFPGSEPHVHMHQPDMSAPELGDYNFLYEHPDPRFPAPAPANTHVAPAVHANIDGAFHHADVRNSSSMHLPNPLQSASPYAGAFPTFGMVPTHLPFSNNAPTVNTGTPLPAGYAHTFRDGLAAAGNLKTMSMQMAAFFQAQQQLYAAQMAQMAALTNNTSFNAAANLFNNPNHMPHFNAHANPPAQQHHGRDPWDVQHSPPRSGGRGKNNGDTFKNSSSTHMNGLGKKGFGMDTPNSKSRGVRGRRGSRGQDDGGAIGSHKVNDRFGVGNNSANGNILDVGHSRSPLLEEFRSTSVSIGRGMNSQGEGSAVGLYGNSNGSSGGREWDLSEITNHIVEFATDQHGSRFIQQKLESASMEDKMAVLKHALTDAQRLMTDVFGNYVVQKLLDHGGPEAVASISAKLKSRMLSLSLHMYGCRVVQKALEVLQPVERSKLVHELNGHVLKCIRDQNGNHVIQKCVELVEPDAVQFIVDAVQGQAVTLAGHSYGCRVVQRILEHGAPHQKTPIMVEIMDDIPNLIKDQYGNYVIQHVVEHGTQQERSVIMNLVRADVSQLSQHKFASNVVERCLQFGSPEEREVLVEILTVGSGPPNPSPLNHLVRDQFGNYVVQRVLDVARPAQRDRVANILKAQVPVIKKYSYGKHIIARLDENLGISGAQQYHQHGGSQGQTGMNGGLNASHSGIHGAQRIERHSHAGMSYGQAQASMYSHQ